MAKINKCKAKYRVYYHNGVSRPMKASTNMTSHFKYCITISKKVSFFFQFLFMNIDIYIAFDKAL